MTVISVCLSLFASAFIVLGVVQTSAGPSKVDASDSSTDGESADVFTKNTRESAPRKLLLGLINFSSVGCDGTFAECWLRIEQGKQSALGIGGILMTNPFADNSVESLGPRLEAIETVAAIVSTTTPSPTGPSDGANTTTGASTTNDPTDPPDNQAVSATVPPVEETGEGEDEPAEAAERGGANDYVFNLPLSVMANPYNLKPRPKKKASRKPESDYSINPKFIYSTDSRNYDRTTSTVSSLSFDELMQELKAHEDSRSPYPYNSYLHSLAL